jgi:hypothetical protein
MPGRPTRFDAFLLALAFALFTFGANAQDRAGPLDIATKFFEANQAGRCADAFPLYSKGTQENIRAGKHRRERERDETVGLRTPEDQHCYSFRQTKRGSVRLVRQSGDEAIVAREYTLGHRSNKYIKLGPWEQGSEELRLIREDGAWRVDSPRLPVGTLASVSACTSSSTRGKCRGIWASVFLPRSASPRQCSGWSRRH